MDDIRNDILWLVICHELDIAGAYFLSCLPQYFGGFNDQIWSCFLTVDVRVENKLDK